MHVVGVQFPYGAPHVPVDVSHVLVRVAVAAFATDDVHDSVLVPEQFRMFCVHVFPFFVYPILQLTIVQSLKADQIPVVVSHVLVCVAAAAFDAVHVSVEDPEHDVIILSTTQIFPEL